MKKVRHKAILDLVRSQEIAARRTSGGITSPQDRRFAVDAVSRHTELGLAKSGGDYTVMGSEHPASHDET
jgi:hypothetical protein